MALINKLSAIGNAIREKTGGTQLLTLDAMPNEIRSISGGGSGGGYEPTDEDLTYTGHCSYLFAYDHNKKLIDLYADRIKIHHDSGVCSYMFEQYSGESLKGITISSADDMTTTGAGGEYMFDNCYNLTELPTIEYWLVGRMSGLFYNCHSLREVPDEFFANFDWSFIEKSSTSTSYIQAHRQYSNCYSLRKASLILLQHCTSDRITSAYSCIYAGTFYSCYALDSITDLPVGHKDLSSDAFNNTFISCNRLNNMTFAPYEGTVAWKNQAINLSNGVGYAPFSFYMTDYNSGITADKEVIDAISYAELKNDPDWFTCDVAYSRYNRDSAIATINSLPTTTGTGCTISFEGAAGSLTDGGAINTLTEEEIAVAAAKGWTVSLI